MLGHIVDTNVKDNKGDNDNTYNPEVEHKMTINWTPPDEKKFLLKRRFVSARMLSKSIPRRSKSIFRYKMSRSLNFDITNSRKNSHQKSVANQWQKSPNSSFDSSSDMDRSSSRDLSRSAKIMRALSLDHNLIRHKNVSIKKSLNFDSPPSSKKISFDGSSHSDSTSANTSVSPTFDKLLSYDSRHSLESVTSSVLIISSESIDENQNQTPQKTRKFATVLPSGNSDTKKNLDHSSESSGSTSLLRSNLKEGIDSILHIVQTPDIQSFKREKSRTLSCVASTPRNLYPEFNQDEFDRPHTPENIMRLIPESMSAIKKSHKKEKLYRQEEDVCMQQIETDISATNEDCIKTTAESSGTDEIIAGGSCDTAFAKQSRMKKRNFKKTLVYDSDDELSDTRSVSDRSAQWNDIVSGENNSSENISNEVEINEMQDTDLSGRERCMKRIQDNDNVHFINDNMDADKDRFDENDCDQEVCLSISQRASSNTHNANVPYDNVMVPPNLSVSQNCSRAITPENHINIIQQIYTESIKKSHKKVKHENKRIFKPRNLHQETELVQDVHDDSKRESLVNVPCSLDSQNSVRPNTPDNINSSRLLLTQFDSVKKSHKKDKHNKRISGLAKCHKYQEYRKRNNNLIRNNKNKQRDINKILHNDSLKSLELKDSLNVSSDKSMNVSTQSVETCRSSCSESSSLGCRNIQDEFKIYTPIKRTSLKLLNASNCACTETSVEENEFVQATPEEVDFSRCMTPIAHCSRKSREDEEAAVPDEYADKSKTDISVSHNELINITDPQDKSGRLTPINMSTTELLCNINCIKRSHKKNKHSSSICKRGGKGSSHNEESKNVSFANSTTTLEEPTTSALQHFGACSLPTETGMCSNTHDAREDESYEGTIYDNPQPSTSRTNDDIRNVMNINESKLLNVTPPNDFNTAKFITLFDTTSIKKFHKKERDYNAETKYILMSNEHDLSDDGSIFDKEDRLSIVENVHLHQDSGNDMYT